MGTNFLDDQVFDYNTSEFVQNNSQEFSYQHLFFEDSVHHYPPQLISSEVLPTTRKRDRVELQAKLSTFKNIDLDVIYRISHILEKKASEIESTLSADEGCWNAIKKIPTWIIVLIQNI